MNDKTRALTLGFGLLFFIILLPSSLIADQQTIRVGVHDAEPLVFLDETGNAQGFIVELIKYIAKEEGWDIVYVSGTWKECLDRLQTGHIDILFPVSDTKERRQYFEFNKEPVFATWGRVFSRSEVPIESILDLDNRSIGIIEDDVFGIELKELVKQFGLQCTFIEIPELDTLFLRVAEGYLDAVAVERIAGHRYAKLYKLESRPVVFRPADAFITGVKGHRNVIDTLDRYLKVLKKDNRSIYYSAYERWIEDRRVLNLPVWISYLLLVCVGLFFLVAVSGLLLRHQVKEKTRELRLRNEELKNQMLMRKRVEEELIRTAQEWQATFDAISDAVCIITLDGMITQSNSATLSLFDLKKEDLKEKHCYQLVHGTSEPFPDCPLARMKKSKRSESMVLKAKNHWFEVSVDPIFDTSGELNSAVHVVSDITERKRAEEALRQYENIVSSSSDMLAFLNKRFNYLAANKAYIEAFKLTPEQLIGHTVAKVFGEEFFNTVIKPSADLCLGGEEVNYQDWFDFPAHGRRYMDITYYPYYGEDNKIVGFVVNGRNITERKAAEVELKKHREHLEEIVKERTAELEEKNAELERFNQLFVGREFRIKELRDRVKELEGK